MKHYTLVVETLERHRFVVEAESADDAMANMETRLEREDPDAVLNSGESLQRTHRIKVDYMKTVRT